MSLGNIIVFCRISGTEFYVNGCSTVLKKSEQGYIVPLGRGYIVQSTIYPRPRTPLSIFYSGICMLTFNYHFIGPV